MECGFIEQTWFPENCEFNSNFITKHVKFDVVCKVMATYMSSQAHLETLSVATRFCFCIAKGPDRTSQV